MSFRLFSTNHACQQVSDQLRLEQLEFRTMLAGNVFASVSDGTLVITGDNADNSILISTFEDPQDGTGFRIQGQANNGPTTVNGSLLPAEFFGVVDLDTFMAAGDDGVTITNDVAAMLASFDGTEPILPVEEVFLSGLAIIDMGDGDNQVDIGWMTTGLRLLVEGGANSDLVRFTGLDVGTNLTVRTFGALDNVFMLDSQVGLATNIRTANGDSWVAIDGFSSRSLFIHGGNHNEDVALNGLTIGDDLTIQGYLGSDYSEIGVPGSFPWEVLLAELTFVFDRLTVRAGDGDNLVDFRLVDAGAISVVGGVDADAVYFQSVFSDRNVYVSTLGGAGTVDFDNVDVSTYLTIVTGANNDDVIITNSTVGTNATINTVGGSDVVDIDNFDVNFNLYVFLGDGTDDLTITGSSASNAYLYGNSGFDRYFHAGNSFGSEHIFSFEQF